MIAWWQMWEGLFSAETCNRVVEEGLKLPSVQGLIGHGGQPVADDNFRLSTIRWVHRRHKHLQDMIERMIELYYEANANAFNFELSNLHEIQFTRYAARDDGKQERYNWHEDLTWKTSKLVHRKLSMVIQLSPPDAYEGGDLQLQNEAPDPSRLRRQGTVIVFPSFHRHCVTPVTKGERFSLVSWYDGPKFR